VARSVTDRARLRERVTGPDVEIVGDSTSLADDLLDRADVLIVMGEELLTRALDLSDDERLAVIGLVPYRSGAYDPAAIDLDSAHSSALRGWALLPDDVDARTLRAAILAADAGLASWPVGWAARTTVTETPPPFVDDDDAFGSEALTPREQEVLELLSIGLSNRRIADRLGISGHTVKFHVAAIYGKLGVSGRTAAVNRALRRGILKI
jgi:DNA-binding CsgD family transcriptional regulator